MKYQYLPGEDLKAESINSIDGRTPAAGYLTGATPSVLATFNALGAATNDGKFKISVDGAAYSENVAVGLVPTPFTDVASFLTQNGYRNWDSNAVKWGQSFLIPTGNTYLKSVTLKITKYGLPADFNVSIYATSGNNPTGAALKTVAVLGSSIQDLSAADPANFQSIVVPFDLAVTENTTYAYVLETSGALSGGNIYYLQNNTTGGYAGGKMCWYSGGGWQNGYDTYDFSFKVNAGKILASLDEVAAAVQVGVRAVTGSLETVVVTNGKFVIKSARTGTKSSVLKLLAPTTGTDISGNGGTPYLNCAALATETPGQGINAQAAGKLLGGSNPSALATWQTLAAGGDNGKIKASIDGTVYDNVAVSLLTTPVANIINQGVQNDQNLWTVSANKYGQIFLVPTGYNFIKTISVYLKKSGNPSNFNLSIYAVSGSYPTGSPLKTVSVPISSVTTSWAFIDIDINFAVTENTSYALVLEGATVDGSSNFIFVSNNYLSAYAGGRLVTYASGVWTNDGGSSTNDMTFKVSAGKLAAAITDVAAAVQTGIRTASGKTETVTYNATKTRFEIVSATANRASQVLKLMSPSTGTDISGAGATAYLDCAANAIEILGTGEENNLARLNENGKIGGDLIISSSDYASKNAGTVYQAECDGFVTAWGSAGYELLGYVDSFNPPTSVRARAYTNGTTHNFLMPVKKGQYWKVTIAAGSATVSWLPWHN